MLYERDYTVLTEKEKKKWEKVESRYNKARKGGIISSKNLFIYWRDLPKAAQHCKSLFANHYLNVDDLKNDQHLSDVKNAFECLLEKKPSEREVISFIKSNQAYFIIGSIFQYFDFGHHSAYLFPEFKLGNEYIVDYLLVGKNSGGYEFIFVELEGIKEGITTENGDFGIAIRKGLKQIEDWDSWIESHFYYLKTSFDKSLSPQKDLPNEFFELDKSRIHYVIVAGRRANFKEKTYRKRRKTKHNDGIQILHYDNLVDGIEWLITAKNYA